MTYSGAISVTVTAGASAAEPQITTKSLPDATVGKAYDLQLQCTDGDAIFSIYYNPGGSNQFDQTGLTLTQHGLLEGSPLKAGSYTFSICAAGEGGEDYASYTLTVTEQKAETTDPTEETAEETVEETVEATEKDGKSKRRRTLEDEEDGKDRSRIIILVAVATAALATGIAITVLYFRRRNREE